MTREEAKRKYCGTESPLAGRTISVYSLVKEQRKAMSKTIAEIDFG